MYEIIPQSNQDLKMARYRRRRFYRKKNKWSIEQRPGFIAGAGWSASQDPYLDRQAFIPIVTATQQEGVRKAKNFTISITTPSLINNASAPSGSTNRGNYTFYYALVYLPEGMPPNELRSQGDLYQPSQNVLKAGIVNAVNGKVRIFSRLARNLNAGDSIYLIIGTNSNYLSSSDNALNRMDTLTQYAICYN